MLLRQHSLSSDALRKLTAGQLLAVHVPAYHAPEVCEELAERILKQSDGAYRRIYESNVRAFTETNGDAEARRLYLNASASVMAEIRHLCHPLASPVDRLRCELDELWPAGARLLRVGGSALVFGMARVWRGGAEAHPHLDVLRLSAPDVNHAPTFTEQLGVNIYLRVPDNDSGNAGMLELWNLGLADGDVIGESTWGTYGYQRKDLPPPEVRIQPKAGDLVMLRTTRVHAVQPTRVGERVTLSGFVGHTGVAHPLLLWS
jgi:hypothetical protein